MEFLTRNSSLHTSVKPRRATLHGREYLVAPLTMIVPGVLNGSKGALYYPPEEISKNHTAWNGMPIVLRHPVINGTHVSARDPRVAEQYEVGRVYASRISKQGKLQAEGWFEINRLKTVDSATLNRLERGEKIELSTGLFTDNEAAPTGATYNGKAYDYIARNYVPDHLAVLPDQQGACSLKDGCGVMVNKKFKVNKTFVANPAWVEDHDLWERAKKQADKGDYEPESEQYYAVVTSIYKKMGGKIGKGKMKTNAKKTPLESDHKTKPTNSKGVSNMKLNEQQKKEIVDNLIANVCCWKEDDRETLNALSDETLTKLQEAGKQAKENELAVNEVKKILGDEKLTANAMPAALKKSLEEKMAKGKKEDEEDEEDEEEEVMNKKKPGCNEETPKTTEEWMKSAPVEVQHAVRNAMRIDAEEKSKLIGVIVANKNNPFSKEQLVGMTTDDLRNLAKLAGPVENKEQSQEYFGMAAPFMTTNQQQIDRSDILPLPVMSFDTK